MKKKNQNKPVSPIYAFGLVWLLYSVFFRLSGLWSLIKCGLLAWAVYSLVKSIVKKDSSADEVKEPENVEKKKSQKKPVHQEAKETVEEQPMKSTGNSELDAVILEGRQSVKRIQELKDDIPDFKLSAQLKQIEILTASIIDQVERKVDKLRQVRQFMN